MKLSEFERVPIDYLYKLADMTDNMEYLNSINSLYMVYGKLCLDLEIILDLYSGLGSEVSTVSEKSLAEFNKRKDDMKQDILRLRDTDINIRVHKCMYKAYSYGGGSTQCGHPDSKDYVCEDERCVVRRDMFKIFDMFKIIY